MFDQRKLLIAFVAVTLFLLSLQLWKPPPTSNKNEDGYKLYECASITTQHVHTRAHDTQTYKHVTHACNSWTRTRTRLQHVAHTTNATHRLSLTLSHWSPTRHATPHAQHAHTSIHVTPTHTTHHTAPLLMKLILLLWPQTTCLNTLSMFL